MENIGDRERPLIKSQTQHRVYQLPKVAVDVTSPQAVGKMKRNSLMSHALSIHKGIDLSDGRGIPYTVDPETGFLEPTQTYEGSPVADANDNRKYPLLWSRRHCRIYVDPGHGLPALDN